MEQKQLEQPKTPEGIFSEALTNIKYPFSGVAPNLIDKFLVLGYEQKTLEYTFQFNEDCEPNINYKTRFRFFDLQERPAIMNEICNDYSKDILENDLILELIFPNIPQMYFLEKQYLNMKKEVYEEVLISPYSIIFSINPQDNSGSKKSYNGLGYIFYTPQEHRNVNNEIDGIFYVPVVYVILSEFPYFYHFNEICKNIYMQMKKETDEIPIDIILYNVVKYCPSPINKTINLSFGAELATNLNKKLSIDKIIAPLNVTSNLKDDKNGIPSIFFNQLSGYPFLDINLSFLFNLIPPEIICEVFIFSFLEHDIIFYSQNPEILNIVMYIFSNFNYPFNDSIYYWHILSVSKESFMSGTSTFVGKTCSTLTGILSEYDSELLTTKKISEHFVLDIDNKNFFFLFQDETDEVKDIMDLYTYIKNCATDADEFTSDGTKIDKDMKRKKIYNDGIQLYDAIHNLMDELQRRAKKVTSIDYNESVVKPTFLTMYEDESEMECMKANLRLQKAFFSFITQMIQNFLSILGVEDEEDINERDQRLGSMVVSIKQPNNKTINETGLNIEEEEEKKKQKLAKRAGNIFREKFKDCSKYSSFVINFCKFHETIDLYKIPYTFINEFIYYSHVAVKNNLSEVDVFKLIDQFYGKLKAINFEEIIIKKNEENEKDKDENIINVNIKNEDHDDKDLVNIFYFSFDKFAEYYKSNLLRAKINREQEDDRDIFTKVKGNQKINNFKTYKRNGFFLSKKILNYYTKYSNNNYNELKKIFKLIKLEYEDKPKKEYKIIDKTKTNSLNAEIKEKSKEKKNKKNDILSDFEIVEKRNEHEIILDSASSFIQNRKKDNNDNKITEASKKEENKNEVNINEEDNEEYIDYDNIIGKDKNEKDLKFYGVYEFMDITDVIEKHFILERCFTSYGLIKFSLLNILAITREIKSKQLKNKTIIGLICDFCEKTKSLVRKYMNIYIKIFQGLKIKNKIKQDEDIDSCIKIITSYFIKTNMIPTEETNAILEIINSNRISKPTSNINSNDEKELEKLDAIPNLFFQNIKPKKLESALKVIETIFSGEYASNSKHINIGYKDLDQLYELIKEDKNNDKSKFVPKTPLSLYSSSFNLLNNYLNNNFTNKKNIYKELEIDILTLLYYFKIPIIGRKWIESYKIEEDISQASKDNKDKNKNKIKDKNKEKEKEKEESNMKKNKEVEELNRIINKIIFVLEDLFNVIKDNKIIN